MINSDIKINIPAPVREILDRLHEHGYEAFIVGGCVRDALLGREPKDWDITTSALPYEVKELFRNTVDTGIQHGTVMVIKYGEGYEVTTYRVDGEYIDGRHPSSVTFTRSLAEDLKRRDFTINAFAWDDNGLIDMFDGLSDLDQGIIRCVGNPDERFNEDALRIMRAVRFSAQLGFTIEPETRAMISKYGKRLQDISRERIRVEFEKTLISHNPTIVNEYKDLGLASYIVGDAADKCFDRQANPIIMEILRLKEMGCWDEETYVSDPEEFYRELTMAAFLMNLMPDAANTVFRSLKYDNRTREEVVRILEYRDGDMACDRVEVKKKLNQMGIDTMMAVLEYRKAFLAAENADEALMEELKELKELVLEVLESKEAWSIAQLAVNGKDLMAAGIPAGKKIGDTLEAILQEVIKNPGLNTLEKLSNIDYLNSLI